MGSAPPERVFEGMLQHGAVNGDECKDEPGSDARYTVKATGTRPTGFNGSNPSRFVHRSEPDWLHDQNVSPELRSPSPQKILLPGLAPAAPQERAQGQPADHADAALEVRQFGEPGRCFGG